MSGVNMVSSLCSAAQGRKEALRSSTLLRTPFRGEQLGVTYFDWVFQFRLESVFVGCCGFGVQDFGLDVLRTQTFAVPVSNEARKVFREYLSGFTTTMFMALATARFPTQQVLTLNPKPYTRSQLPKPHWFLVGTICPLRDCIEYRVPNSLVPY